MKYSPEFDVFSQKYQVGETQLVWQEMAADIDTPITASIKLKQEGKPFFLLESVENGERRGRYSGIGLEPDIIWRCSDEHAEMSLDGGPFEEEYDDVLTSFRQVYENAKFDVPTELPPMASGLIGYMSYDAIRLVETTVSDENPDKIDIPTGLFMRPTVMVIFDSVKASLYIMTVVKPVEGASSESRYQSAQECIQRIVKTLQTATIASYHVNSEAEDIDLSFESNMTRDEYHQMVEKAKEYIYAGDIFQVVPSQRFSTPFEVPAFALYRSLRHLNPSPFLFYLDFGDFQLVGSSPELLVRLKDDVVTIRPLAGTRMRGETPEEDKALEADLLADEKEISEHLMLIDLSRNDVGRVTKPGTVEVTEHMIVERYSHVMHISSNVQGELDPEYDALDALFSGLPVGTVSGAPKVRAMQIIDELEKEKRSFYAGCVGYFSANGSMDTCITLRTGLVKDGVLYCQAGGGVVADSDPETEYQESCNKAKALMQAARRAGRFS